MKSISDAPFGRLPRPFGDTFPIGRPEPDLMVEWDHFGATDRTTRITRWARPGDQATDAVKGRVPGGPTPSCLRPGASDGGAGAREGGAGVAAQHADGDDAHDGDQRDQQRVLDEAGAPLVPDQTPDAHQKVVEVDRHP